MANKNRNPGRLAKALLEMAKDMRDGGLLDETAYEKITGEKIHITPAGENIFADLGFQPEEAAELQAESKRIISEKLAGKES